jgi:hypothetical protein
VIQAEDLVPYVSWGTTPAQTVPLDGEVPEPTNDGHERALKYMDLTPGTPIREIEVDTVFLGSCTNARIEDLRAAARVLEGQKVKEGIRAMVVPGSMRVKKQAEAEGLAENLHGGRLRLAQRRLLDVPRHEPGHPAAGRALRLDLQPKLRGPSGQGRKTHLVSPAVAAGDGRHGALRLAFRTRRTRGGALVEPVQRVSGKALPLGWDDVDTDQIVPSDALKRIERTGFGQFLFSQWREDPEFVLNKPEHEGAVVLLAGRTSAAAPAASTRRGPSRTTGSGRS